MRTSKRVQIDRFTVYKCTGVSVYRCLSDRLAFLSTAQFKHTSLCALTCVLTVSLLLLCLPELFLAVRLLLWVVDQQKMERKVVRIGVNILIRRSDGE